MYTTDNTVPTLTNGNALAGPITLSKSTSLTAVAIGKNGKSKYIHADYDIKNADAGKTVFAPPLMFPFQAQVNLPH